MTVKACQMPGKASPSDVTNKEEEYEKTIKMMFKHFTTALLQRPREYIPIPIAGWPCWPEISGTAIAPPGADDHTSNHEGGGNASGMPYQQATTEAIIDELSLQARQEDKCGKKEKQPDKPPGVWAAVKPKRAVHTQRAQLSEHPKPLPAQRGFGILAEVPQQRYKPGAWRPRNTEPIVIDEEPTGGAACASGKPRRKLVTTGKKPTLVMEEDTVPNYFGVKACQKEVEQPTIPTGRTPRTATPEVVKTGEAEADSTTEKGGAEACQATVFNFSGHFTSVRVKKPTVPTSRTPSTATLERTGTREPREQGGTPSTGTLEVEQPTVPTSRTPSTATLEHTGTLQPREQGGHLSDSETSEMAPSANLLQEHCDYSSTPMVEPPLGNPCQDESPSDSDGLEDDHGAASSADIDATLCRRGYVTCKEDHQLRIFDADVVYECDHCQVDIPKNERIAYCDRCDFCLCRKCTLSHQQRVDQELAELLADYEEAHPKQWRGPLVAPPKRLRKRFKR